MKSIFFIASTLFILGCSHSLSHDTIAAAPEPVAVPLTLPTSESRLPCEMHKGVCVVRARVGGSSPLALVVDTGSSLSVLDSKVATGLGLHELAHGQAAGAGVTASQSYSSYPLTEFRVGDLVWPSQKILSLPFTYASARIGTGVDGTLGANILKNFIVKLEVRHGRVTLFSPDGWKDDGSYRSLDMDLVGDVPVMTATLIGKSRNGLPQKGLEGHFIIDTGQVTAGLFLAPKFLADHAEFFDGICKTKRAPLTSVGGDFEFSEGIVSGLKMAVDTIPQVKAAFLATAGGVYAKNDIDGGIGPDVLKYFEVVLDYPHKTVYFRRVK